MQFGPLHDHVPVRQIKQEQKTVGGGIIPNTLKYKARGGKVRRQNSGARTQDRRIRSLGVKVDDRVPFRHVVGF